MDQTHTPADNPKLDALLAGYLEAVERGEKPDRAQLIAANPDLAAELQAFFTDLDRVQRVAADPAHASTVIRPDTDPSPGIIIAGRYKLLENIGEGGMGSVWVAEQLSPVKRRVAIKLIKAGMDSKQVLARFEAERQALAVMDHPNIAKVFDGGLTEQGRPYFVMEYVKGVPLTDYCDRARLPLKDRLALFVQVCSAVQHAHQKGIIHRDLKPSNILICLYDGHPVPKVIDFGLAKAMHQPLTEQSIYTGHGVMVGTPLYMSPEQAELNNLDIDTRTDIYSLGVVLYELLTGSTPLERNQLQVAAFEEMLRLIKEVEPPRPSLRLSGSDSLPSIAAQRSIDPKHLSRSLAGDLDWIVMKALDKERSRRYETAIGLSRDIERFLAEEPVEACPPSTVYRIKKYIKRHKGPVIAATVLLLTLVLGIFGTSWGLYQAELANEKTNHALGQVTKERDAKEAERQKATKAKNDADSARQAESVQRIKAERQLLAGILRPIGFNDTPEEAELNALADWSALSDSRIKLMGLELALEEPVTAWRIASRADRVIQAVIGTSPQRRSQAINLTISKQRDMKSDPRIRLAACWFALELGSTELPALDECITYVSKRVNEAPYQFFNFIHSCDSHISHERMTAVFQCMETLTSHIENGELTIQVKPIFRSLLTIASHMHPEQVDSFAARILNSITRNTFNSDNAIATHALVSLCPSMSDKMFDEVINTFLTLEIQVDGFADRTIWESIDEVFPRIEQRLTEHHVDKLFVFLRNHPFSDPYIGATPTLKGLLPRFDAEKQEVLMNSCLESLKAPDSKNNRMARSHYWECLAFVLSHLPSHKVAPHSDEIVSLAFRDMEIAWKSEQMIGLSSDARSCVEQVITFLDSVSAQKYWDLLIASMESHKRDANSDRRIFLSTDAQELLKMLATRLTPEEQVKQWDIFVAAHRGHLRPNDITTPYIYEFCLIALAPHLSKEKVNSELMAILPTLSQKDEGMTPPVADHELAILSPRLSSHEALLAWQAYTTLLGTAADKCDGTGLGKLGVRLNDSDRNLAADGMLTVLESDIEEKEITKAEMALSSIAKSLSSLQATRVRLITIPRLEQISNDDIAKTRVELLAGVSRQLIESDKEQIVSAVTAMAENENGVMSLWFIISERPFNQDFIPNLNANLQFRLAETCLEHNLDLLLTDHPGSPMRFMDSVVRDRVSARLLQRILDQSLSNSSVDFYDLSSESTAHLYRCCAEMNAPRTAAKFLAHPGCVGPAREALLMRFEEILFHGGKAMLLKPMNQEPLAKDANEAAVQNTKTGGEEKVSRRFRNLNEAVNWIEQNWPGFDLEATPSVEWPTEKREGVSP